jgi:hypothetical protein
MTKTPTLAMGAERPLSRVGVLPVVGMFRGAHAGGFPCPKTPTLATGLNALRKR